MGVDALILVQVGCVAVGTGSLVLGRVDRDGNHLAANVVVYRLMAVGALEIEAAHMDVLAFLGEQEALVEVPVLDAVAATAVEVALAAVVTGGAAHALCGGDEVHFLYRVAVVTLGVEAGIGVAYQAVNILLRSKVIRQFFPAIARMAGRTRLLIAFGADAEVVDLVEFADGDRLIARAA